MSSEIIVVRYFYDIDIFYAFIYLFNTLIMPFSCQISIFSILWSKETKMRYVPQEEDGEGLSFAWPEGDKIDHSSITPEQSHQEVMTLYKALCLLERVKRISEYKISYTDCARAVASAGSDGFNVAVKQAHKYKYLGSSSERTTAKSFFGNSMSEVESSSMIQKVFRFRFERVSSCIKIQKPYVMVMTGLTLKPNQPVQVA